MRVDRLELVLPDTTVGATLHWEDAPLTCQMISDLLSRRPLTETTHHAIWVGHEFYVYIPPVEIELENHVVRVEPGQLVYYFMPAGRNAGMPVHQRRLGRRDIAEVAIFYGPADLRIVTEANYRGNLFATVDNDDLPRLFEAGRRTLDRGEQPITITASSA